MEKFDALNDFIDGLLPEEEESRLFLALSGDDEMRTHLKNIYAVRGAIAADSAFFTPSAGSTSAIFNTLGLPVPGETVAPNRRKYIIPLLLTLFITAFLTWFLTDFFGQRDYPESMLSGNQSREQISNNVPNTGIPSISSSELQIDEPGMPKKMIRPVPVATTPELSINEEAGNDSPSNNKDIALIYEANGIAPRGTIQLNNSHGTIDLPNGPNRIEPLPYKFQTLSGISLEMKGNQSFSVPEATIQPSWNPVFANSDLSLMYKLSDNFSTGVDIRRETFYQEYSGMDEHGIINNYYQQPNFVSYGGVMRYQYEALDWLYPLGQITLGGNKAGFVYRGMLGFEIVPYEKIGFIFGFEYNGMIFKHLDEQYRAGKYGFKYGVSLKF